MTDKELRSLYNFYKNSEKGFVTRDGYAAIPSDGKKVGVAVSYTHLTLPTTTPV